MVFLCAFDNIKYWAESLSVRFQKIIFFCNDYTEKHIGREGWFIEGVQTYQYTEAAAIAGLY